MDVGRVAPLLAAGGTNRNGEVWRFEIPATEAMVTMAATCWVVPFLPDGRIVAVATSAGRLHIPGGTLEASESWEEGARRELIEEIGAEVGTIDVFGAVVSDQRVRLTAWAEVGAVGVPAEPETSGTYVVAVRVGTPDEIVSALERDDQGVLADIYRVAIAMRAS
jgi:ADP-ribose pyrophosphatase YjhB (NUDIX family)